MEDRRAQIAQERRLQQRADERRADRAFDRRLKAEAKRDRRVEKALAERRKEIREYRAEARRDLARAERRAEKRYAQRAAYRDWLEQGERRAVVQRIADEPVRFVRTGTQVSRDWYQPRLPTAYRSRYVDDRNSYYRYDPYLDNIYRIDRTRNVVRSVIPAYYSPNWIGRSVPSYYDQGYVPYGYGSAYYPTSNSYYRTVGPAVYRVDPTTQLITAVVALLTGQDFSVGQRMPTGYDVYNVPTSYRSQYYDTSDAWYRYDDGTVYQIDPRTRYVTDAYPLYEADYMVGSPWPTDYPDYNVPYGYQGLYYDTPDASYRYADNAIYRVDPATQLITALVSLVTGQPLSVGQPMPASYGVYNVPQQYRSRFVERPDVNYRYVDGYVYAVDPDSYLITDSYDLYT